MRFLENHDEPRIADKLPAVLERAAAVTIATLPGATLWHEGQFEGRRVRPPVFLARRPDEPLDQELAAWHRGLVSVVAEQGVRTGAWQLLEVAGWPDNQSGRNLIAWSWTPGDDAAHVRRHVIVVNLSLTPGPGPDPAAVAGPAGPPLAAA